MGNNFFNGTIPNTYKDCGDLEIIVLKENQLEGELPSSLSKCRILKVLDLGNNRLNGIFRNRYKDCGQLGAIILNGNQLEGRLPSSLSKCRYLKVLDLRNNHLNGTFPNWLGGLPLLQVLDLRSNNFHGSINASPTKRFSFPSLQVLDLSHNGFVGNLPRKYFRSFSSMKNIYMNKGRAMYMSVGGMYYYSMIATVKGVEQNFPQIFVDYTIVDLSNNKFDGDIPDIIGSLTSLTVLNLSNNSHTGQIPDSLGDISELESLDLSGNQLTGQIPQSLATLKFLEFLNLSQNHLAGRIPTGTQFSTFDASFGGNPGLCGFPLPNPCELKSSPQLEAGEDDESGFTWNSVMLGSGCGILVGYIVNGIYDVINGKTKVVHCKCECDRANDRQEAKQDKTHIYWEMISVF